MPNMLQKWVYNLSSLAPLCLVFALVWWTEMHTIEVPRICIGVFLVFVGLFVLMFKYAKKNLSPITVSIKELSPQSEGMSAYIFSYILPFGSMVIKDMNLPFLGVMAVLIIIILPFVSPMNVNPLLVLAGYHFYQFNTEYGVSGYVLISKKKLRNTHDVRYVKRIFEFLLLDEGEK